MLNEALQHAAKLEKTRESKYDELFTSEERAELDAFVAWLVDVEGFKSTSASSYRANFSRACSKNFEDLTSDEKSALRKFEAYKK